jgi:UDP-2,3-diacylglucosamine pyrophosphatase LpxH
MGVNMSVTNRLAEVFKSSEEIHFNNSQKFILFSDCHRGDNSWEDDFAPNQNIFFHAINSYYEGGFTYIEIGDGDELWKNRDFGEIRRAHDHIFWALTKFHEKNRLFLIWGNHNRKWKRQKNVERYLHNYELETGKEPGAKPTLMPLFKGIRVREGLILRHSETNRKIFLTHGHQGGWLNDELWWVGKFVVRNIWKILQVMGFKDPTSPAKNNTKRQILENGMAEWINSKNGKEERQDILIVGHTHRPYQPQRNEIPYFNTGSCVHPRCITGLEIEKGEITLIKWFIDVDSTHGGLLFVKREPVTKEPYRL